MEHLGIRRCHTSRVPPTAGLCTYPIVIIWAEQLARTQALPQQPFERGVETPTWPGPATPMPLVVLPRVRSQLLQAWRLDSAPEQGTSATFASLKFEPATSNLLQAWFPVNVIFVGMIWSSFLALKNLGVPMATVLKNLTILITISGDYVFYGRTYGCGVWSSMGLVVLSAICGAATDMAFDVYGYVWQLINCFFTAAYSLYLRGVMDKVVMLTQSQTKMNEFSMVFYNNFLSLPVLAVLIVYQGELKGLQDDAGLRNPRFILAAMASALAAFGISFASLWFLSCTTATTYGLVGSLNKVPIAFLGLIAFHVPANAQNMLSVLLGLIAGILFVNAKQTSGK